VKNLTPKIFKVRKRGKLGLGGKLGLRFRVLGSLRFKLHVPGASVWEHFLALVEAVLLGYRVPPD